MFLTYISLLNPNSVVGILILELYSENLLLSLSLAGLSRNGALDPFNDWDWRREFSLSLILGEAYSGPPDINTKLCFSLAGMTNTFSLGGDEELSVGASFNANGMLSWNYSWLKVELSRWNRFFFRSNLLRLTCLFEFSSESFRRALADSGLGWWW
jgi:hypothetical protein